MGAPTLHKYQVRPASAGMSPPRLPFASSASRAPRVSGDEPLGDAVKAQDEGCAPRQRG